MKLMSNAVEFSLKLNREEAKHLLLSMLQKLTKIERFTIIDDNFCRICFGDNKPCYCAPTFDE